MASPAGYGSPSGQGSFEPQAYDDQALSYDDGQYGGYEQQGYGYSAEQQAQAWQAWEQQQQAEGGGGHWSAKDWDDVPPLKMAGAKVNSASDVYANMKETRELYRCGGSPGLVGRARKSAPATCLLCAAA
jgi:hypothetical protein